MVIINTQDYFKIIFYNFLIGIFTFIIFTILIILLHFTLFRKNFHDIKYAIIIDCGSSGSRIHVFKWFSEKRHKNLPNVQRLRSEDELVMMKSNIPLTSFVQNPKLSIRYIQNLLEPIYLYIPDKKHAETDLYILATAGMRNLGKNERDEIINEIRENLPKKIKFNLKKVEVISGRMEGLFMWISLNFSLKNFQKLCGHTYNVIEMGGASTQIAFETLKNIQDTLNFSYLCPIDGIYRTHYIYSVTFLGLGANKAFDYYRNISFKEHRYFEDPCLPKNCIDVEYEKILIGNGNQNLCFKKICNVFDIYFYKGENYNIYKNMKARLDAENYPTPRPLYGLSSFHYAFSNFLYYSGPLLPEMYWNRSQEFCKQECNILTSNMLKNLYKTDKLAFLHMQCFRVPFMRYVIDKLFKDNEKKPVINHEGHRGDPIDYTYGAIVYFLNSAKK